MIHKKQLKDLIEKTLKEYNLYSEEAANLVYGTVIQESVRGTYIKQNVENFDYDKHALGISQVERNTFEWLRRVFVVKIPELAKVSFKELEYNLKYSILFCRLRYKVDKEPIPKDLEGQAQMWKRVYNTIHGAGTVEEYINNYKKSL